MPIRSDTAQHQCAGACGQLLPRSAFARRPRKPGGIAALCLICEREARLARQRAYNYEYYRRRHENAAPAPMATRPPASPKPASPALPIKPVASPSDFKLPARDLHGAALYHAWQARQKRRAADPALHAYRIQLFRAAVSALVSIGIEKTLAGAAVQAIARGRIKGVAMDYEADV